MKTVLQIIPAGPGWFSTYKDGEHIIKIPVVMWVLTSDDIANPPYTQVEGVENEHEVGMNLCESSSNFNGYVHEPDEKDLEKFEKDVSSQRHD